MAYLPKRENLILSKPGCRHGILTYLGLLNGEHKNVSTTLGAEKKRNDLTKKKVLDIAQEQKKDAQHCISIIS